MKPKLKPELDLDAIQDSVIDEVVKKYNKGSVSLRSVAKSTGFSMTKVRKILITAGEYSTETSSAVGAAYKDGLSVGEIARTLGMSESNVYLYLPYQTILYGLDERSVDADRQARYRERKALNSASVADQNKELRTEKIDALKAETQTRIERRSGIMYIGINEKLRKTLPKGFCSEEQDPYKNMITSGFEPEEPRFHMWSADLAVKGRGKNKKTAMVVENARCGFAVMLPLLPIPSVLTAPAEEREEDEFQAALKEYRELMSDAIDRAIYEGFRADYYPEERVSNALGDRIVFVKSNDSFQHRVTELCERIERNVDSDPMELDRVKLNSGDRKFGNSPWYRRVEDETAECLGMTREEAMEMIRKKYSAMRLSAYAEKIMDAGSVGSQDGSQDGSRDGTEGTMAEGQEGGEN